MDQAMPSTLTRVAMFGFLRCGGNNGACPESDVDPVLQFSPAGYPASVAVYLCGLTVLLWTRMIICGLLTPA